MVVRLRLTFTLYYVACLVAVDLVKKKKMWRSVKIMNPLPPYSV